MNKAKRCFCLFLSALLLAAGTVKYAGKASAETLSEMFSSENKPVRFNYEKSADYSEKLAEYEQNGYKPAQINERIFSSDFSADNGEKPALCSFADKENVFLWDESLDSCSVKISVPSSGLYTFGFTYLADTKASADIVRSMTLDGEIPFEQANTLRFERKWYVSDSPKKNAAGDEVSPRMEQKSIWQENVLYDGDGEYSRPLEVYLEAGEHYFKFGYVSMSLYVSNFFLDTYTPPLPYETVITDWESSGVSKADEEIIFEAEDSIAYSNRSTYRMSSDGDPLCSPISRGYTVMNIVGGDNGKDCGASITFSFDVKKAGLYKLAFRDYQNYRDGLPSYKKIEIDGRVPFEEFSEYSFYNQSYWRTEVLGNDKPYLIYLSEGSHTLTLTNLLGKYKALNDIMEKDAQTLSDLLLEIRKIIGSDPDYNYDYNLGQKIPDLNDTLDSITSDMSRMMTMISDIAKRDTAKYNELKNMINQVKSIQKNIFKLPRRISDLDTIVTQYSSWISQFSEAPLGLDYIVFSSPDEKLENKHSNFFQNFYSTIVNFVISFSKDYDNISASGGMSGKRTIDVWISRGTSWGEAVKELIDNSFTPSSGINVNMNIVTAGQLNAGSVNTLMLSIASGTAPDVCLGVATESVGEFAMRGVLSALNDMEGFEELKATTYPENYVPNTYMGKVFGIPETMNFSVLIYRKDILADLSLPLPQTWDDIYQSIIPVLTQNNMKLYLPLNTGWTLYPTFLYQLGGKVYNDELTACDFGSDAANSAFEELTRLVTTYGLPTSANFFNRFRSGECPIGYGDMTTYLQFVTAAPEIAGRWGVSRLPGHRNSDGTVDYTRAGGSETSVIVLDNGKKNTEESWNFVKWWMSGEIQTEFGYLIESEMGAASRWNSANIESFCSMAWDRSELEVIKQSFSDAKGLPIVLGGYYTSRYLNTAYNKSAISSQDCRDSLENAKKEIDNELERRRKKQKS